MKNILILTVLLSLSPLVHAQKDTAQRQETDQVFTLVQQMPKFNGDMQQYLADSLQYPENEKETGVMGTVYITFIVEKDGSLSGIKVLKGVPGGPGLDAEALRVIKGMPKWIPGKQHGNLVRVRMNVPIRFELR